VQKYDSRSLFPASESNSAQSRTNNNNNNNNNNNSFVSRR